jgi:L-2-hydroxyglutarate oxidase LhgO
VLIGPTALLWPRRPGDLSWPGTARMLRRWWRTGVAEIRHATSRRAFAEAARRFVPDLRDDDIDTGKPLTGLRAQALGRDGQLVDDFVFSRTERALHVRNAPSPGATSALAIARVIADELGVDRT